MPEPYCRSCYRTLPDDRTACFSCDVAARVERGSSAGRAGLIGVPLLIAGIVAHIPQLCYAAAIVSVGAIAISIIRLVGVRRP